MVFASTASAQTVTVWIGTTTPRDGDSKGIYRTELNLESGQLSHPELVAEVGSPGFLAQHPTANILYSVCQLPDGQGPGVVAWKISDDESTLSMLSGQPIGDGGATHVAVDGAGEFLFTAQYSSGSVAMFPLNPDGKVMPRCDLHKHSGQGPDESRQQAPHPHWVGLSPDNRFLFVPDLGIDQVVIYRIDRDQQKLVPHGSAAVPPAAGPRHMKFHPNGKWAYVLNELALSVTVFDYATDSGTLTPKETVVALPESMREVPNTASEIRIHPSGKFVYTANRGHDSISVFRIDEESGALRFVEHESIRGSWPRNFNVDPSGRWLIAAGRNSNTLAVFEIDPTTGGMVYSGQTVNCPTPICVEFQKP